MRKFIYSDLHGNGNMYHTIMSYLDKTFKPKKLILLPDNIVGYEDWIK